LHRTKKPTIEQLKTIHYRLIQNQKQDYIELAKYNEEKLKSILDGADQSCYGQDMYPTICDKAMHILRGIESSQLFPDGNKRVALATFEIFLKMNRSKINKSVTEDMKIKFMLDIANHKINKKKSVKCCIKAIKD